MRLPRLLTSLLDLCAIAAPVLALRCLTNWVPGFGMGTPSTGPEKAAYLLERVGDSVLALAQGAIVLVLAVVVCRCVRPCSPRIARSALVAQASLTVSLTVLLGAAYFAVEGVRWQVLH